MKDKLKTVVNRTEVVRAVAEYTGYTQEVVREILSAKDKAVAQFLSEGYSVKEHKLFRLDLVVRPEKKNAYDGVNKKNYVIPEQVVVKLRPLKGLKDALEELNKDVDQ